MSDWWKTEDWWAVWIGLLVFVLSLGTVGGFDLFGWGVATQDSWLYLDKAMAPVSAKHYAGLPGFVSLIFTYLFLLAVLSVGARFLGLNLRRFIPSFTVVFWVSYACLLLGHYAYIAAVPNKRAGLHIDWSLGLTGEAGYILALLAGLVIGNF